MDNKTLAEAVSQFQGTEIKSVPISTVQNPGTVTLTRPPEGKTMALQFYTKIDFPKNTPRDIWCYIT